MFKKLLLAALFFLPSVAFADRFGAIRSSDDVSLSTETILNTTTAETGKTASPEYLLVDTSATVRGVMQTGTQGGDEGTFQVYLPSVFSKISLWSGTAAAYGQPTIDFLREDGTTTWIGNLRADSLRVLTTNLAGTVAGVFGAEFMRGGLYIGTADGRWTSYAGTPKLLVQGNIESVYGLIAATAAISGQLDAGSAVFQANVAAGTFSSTDTITAANDVIAQDSIGSNSGNYNYAGTTITYAAPAIDTSDRIPILNNGAVSWPLAVTDGARLASTQTFTASQIWTSSMTVKQATDCSSFTGEGELCWDTNDNILYLGNGATTTAVGPGAGSGDAVLAATQTFSGGNTFSSPSGVAVTYGVSAASFTASDLTASRLVYSDTNKKLASVTTNASVLLSGSSFGVDPASGTLLGNVIGGDASGTLAAFVVTNDSHDHTSTTISGIDVSADVNLTAGRSLTLTGDDVLADAELYTDSKTLYFESPVAADDFKTIWANTLGSGVTITKISCESDQTVNFDLQVDDGSPTGVNGSDIACTTFATDSTLAGDTTMADGERLDLAISSVSGTPTWVSITFTFTKDD